MCGLVGVIRPASDTGQSPALAALDVARALNLIRHRGPDAQRLTFFFDDAPPLDLPLSDWLSSNPSDISTFSEMINALSTSPSMQGKKGDGNSGSNWHAALGHARLKIIDLSEAARQPMRYVSPDGQARWMVFNGEIYNYQELRQELIQRGYMFNSDSDTEVLLALYDAEGPAMLRRLNGMFAFAIWDERRGEVFLGRDRYGVKPLYYTTLTDGSLAFASEMKSLLALPGCSRRLNAQALYEHFTFQYSLANQTLIEGIQAFPAGHWGVHTCKTGALHLERYWSPVFEETTFHPNRMTDQIAELRAVFEQAVHRQLVGDVPIGSFLSGGMDTGAITAVAAQMIPGMHTFTCGFDVAKLIGQEQLFDETQAARELARVMKTRHHEMSINASVLPEVLNQVVWHLDDFRAGISYQNYLVNRFVRGDVTVVLSGVGGDELFAGYPWRYQPVLELADPTAFQQRYYQSWVRLLSDEQKQQLFSEDFLGCLSETSTEAAFVRALNMNPAEHPLHRALNYDFTTFLQALLTVEDRLSMAFGLESRVPFLDNDLVDLCLRLPAESKLHCSPETGEPIAKWILKEALKGLLPDDVLNRRKQGFTPPDATWYRTVHRPWIESILLSDQALSRGLFQPDMLQSLLESHFSGAANHRFLIWSLLCLETWQRQFLDQNTPGGLPGVLSSRPQTDLIF